MVSSGMARAAALPEAKPTIEHYARYAGYAAAGYVGLLFGVLAITLVLSLLMLAIVRLNGPESPFARRMTARFVARTKGGSAHRSDDRGAPAEIARGLAALAARDPHFDEQAVLRAARRALFFAFAAGIDGDDRRLRQVSTEAFWKSPVAVAITETASHRKSMVEHLRQRTELVEAAKASGHPMPTGTDWMPVTPVPLDYQAHEVEFHTVTPDDHGFDRIVVRLAFRGETALAGVGAASTATAMAGRFKLGAATQQSGSAARPPGPTTARIGNEGWYDWEFVRPATERSGDDDGVAGRRCSQCGSPFRTDLDVACRACKAPRPSVGAGWKLDRSWLVVDTEARAGVGGNRAAHDASWALRGAGKIALKVAEAALEGS